MKISAIDLSAVPDYTSMVARNLIPAHRRYAVGYIRADDDERVMYQFFAVAGQHSLPITLAGELRGVALTVQNKRNHGLHRVHDVQVLRQPKGLLIDFPTLLPAPFLHAPEVADRIAVLVEKDPGYRRLVTVDFYR